MNKPLGINPKSDSVFASILLMVLGVGVLMLHPPVSFQALFRSQNRTVAGGVVPTCSGYSHWGTITAFPTPGSTLTDKPLWMHATVAALKTTGNGGQITNTSTENGVTVPDDFILLATNGTTLLGNFEVPSYSVTTGEIWAVVKYPSFTTGSITLFYCAGNSGVTTFQGNTNGTWPSQFKFVTHGGVTDSTASANTITDHNGTTAGTGQLGPSRVFNGTTQYVDFTMTNFPSASGPRSTFAWIRLTDVTVNYSAILSYGDNVTDQNFGFFVYPTDSKLHAAAYNNDCRVMAVETGSTGTISVNTWTHVGVTFDGTSLIRFYINGAASGTCDFQDNLNTTLTFGSIGTDADVSVFLPGQVNHSILTNDVLSADWIAAAYANQLSPAVLSAATAF